MTIGIKNCMGVSGISFYPKADVLGILQQLLEGGYISFFVIKEHYVTSSNSHLHIFVKRIPRSISEENLLSLLPFDCIKRVSFDEFNDYILKR